MKTIQGKLLIIFLAFLFTSITNLIFVFSSGQKEMGITINVAGRQRMLSQKITKEVFEYKESRNMQELETLKKTAMLFETSLDLLITGDKRQGVLSAKKGPILSQLNTVKKLWEIFNNKINSIIENKSNINESYSYIIKNNSDLLLESNRVVELYEKRSSENAKLTKIINLGIVFANLLIIIVSWFFIVNPLIKKIINTSNNLLESSKLLRSTSDEVATFSSDLSNSATEQASALEESSASLEELSVMVKNNVESAKESTVLSAEVQEISVKAIDEMGLLLDSMKVIQKSGTELQDLESIISEIGVKTAVIDDIVFQTKLLSFNASVESERAGEHGRGFAVVAQEVGSLAAMSGEAALVISTIVKECISKVSIVSEHNVKAIQQCSEQVAKTEDVLNKIEENSNNALKTSNAIQVASSEQSTGISEINNAVSLLDTTTQKNALNAESTAQSSRNLNQLVLDLNVLVEELAYITKGQTL